MDTNWSHTFREIKFWESENYWKTLLREWSLFIDGGEGGGDSGEGISCHQQSIKGKYRKLKAIEKGDQKICMGGPGVIVGEIYCHQQSIKGNYRKLTANEKGDHKNITGGRPGVIVGEIYYNQQSIKGDYRKLTANEKGDHCKC